jgi:DNA polymerase-3 subunit epsilon
VHTYAVIDFETTGLSAGPDRIIEVGAVLVRDEQIVGTFSELMDPGFRIPSFITALTGISDAMVRGRPRPEVLMPRLRGFLGDHVCIAHNASFDQRFFHAEMALAGEAHERPFLCSMLLSRRLVPDAASHKLGALVRHLRLPTPSGMQAHRALADALMTVELWKRLMADLRMRLAGRQPDSGLIATICKKPKSTIPDYLTAVAAQATPLLQTG